MISNHTRKWIRAGLEAFITGATASVSAAVGVTITDPGNWGATVKSLRLMAVTAVISGGFRFFHWWNANPLPEDDTSPPLPGAPEPAMISMNPLSKVQSIPKQPDVSI
jgi:hypothetical protein